MRDMVEIKLPPHLQSVLESAPAMKCKLGFTPEEDAFLILARKKGVYWGSICKALGCGKDLALRRYRELMEEK